MFTIKMYLKKTTFDQLYKIGCNFTYLCAFDYVHMKVHYINNKIIDIYY